MGFSASREINHMDCVSAFIVLLFRYKGMCFTWLKVLRKLGSVYFSH